MPYKKPSLIPKRLFDLAMTPWADLSAWAGTAGAGLVASAGGWNIVPAIVIIFLCLVPLAVRSVAASANEKRDAHVDARGIVATNFLANSLSEIAALERLKRQERVTGGEEFIEKAMRHLYENYFDSHRKVRVALYQLTKESNALEAIISYPNEPRRKLMIGDGEQAHVDPAQLTDPEPYIFISPVNGDPDAPPATKLRSFDQFISSPVRAGADRAYGLLTVDAEGSDILDDRDGSPIHGYASAIAFMYETMRRGMRQSGGGNEEE